MHKDLMPLKGEQYSHVMTEKLSDMLQKYTTVDDRLQVSSANGVSFATVSITILRKNAITKKNVNAMVDMVRIAIDRCEESIKEARKAKKELQQIINQK